MTYTETIDYLYHVAPLFQNIGAGAYKEGLANTHALDEHFGHPHRHYRTIHVAGTNGKGSVSHTLAAILQQAGLKVGLFTSPHLLDFRERIRVNGRMIDQQRVVDFVEQERCFFEPLHPSFFELTTALAFLYFAEQEVDVAVIEVGLGGRLDCTNIITPDLSVITNISFDHQQFLGDTLPKIATEKAGIIKPGVPVVIGETAGNSEVRDVFVRCARQMNAPYRFADEEPWVVASEPADDGGRDYALHGGCRLRGQLGGDYQVNNTSTVLCAFDALLQQTFYACAFQHHPTCLFEGLAHVCDLTGLQGRWQCVGQQPRMVCDVGHNLAGIRYVSDQLQRQQYRTLRIVFGMVNDKDVRGALATLPTDAVYYFTQPSCARAVSAGEICSMAAEEGIVGRAFPTVAEAVARAIGESSPDDFVFVGGSCYVVADLLAAISSSSSSSTKLSSK